MTTFDDREHAFEAHFAFEEELEFKVKARRDRLVGLWAGGLMGLQAQALEDYVRSLVHVDLSEANSDHVYTKVLSDLAASGLNTQPQEVRDRIAILTAEAREGVGADEGPSA